MVANSGPTTFTDEKLKELKKMIAYNQSMHDYFETPIRNDTLEALIGRLKAAENCIKIAQEMLGENLWQEKVWQEYLNIWRERH